MGLKNKILIVDDESQIRELLQTFLIAQGYKVNTADNGGSAVDLLFNDHYDLVISDIAMPEFDGLELLKKLKENDKRVNVIMMTGYPSSETERTAREYGAVDYLLKPLDFKELSNTVSRLLEK
ncbi:MAG: response regulator [Gemmatimonadota bacterium]|nr:response regulator [Gemmatimonadota bacterium]